MSSFLAARHPTGQPTAQARIGRGTGAHTRSRGTLTGAYLPFFVSERCNTRRPDALFCVRDTSDTVGRSFFFGSLLVRHESALVRTGDGHAEECHGRSARCVVLKDAYSVDVGSTFQRFNHTRLRNADFARNGTG